MDIPSPAYLMDTMRRRLGMVIPVWFPPDLPCDRIRDTLRATLQDCEHYLAWEHVVLVVDGDERSYQVVRELQGACRQRHGSAFDIVRSAENRGKGYAVCLGSRWMLERASVEYVTTRDADGDHALNDLMHLMRLGLTLQGSEPARQFIVIGRRNHPHRSLGFVRGEFETLLNRVLIDAVRFALAQRQEILRTQYFSLLSDYPDLHSGYKLYSRAICERMVQQPWERPPWVGDEIYRYGVEAVPFVEGVLVGAVVGEVARITFEPDFSGHAAFGRPDTNGGVLLWTFLRLEIPQRQAAMILDNHIPRLRLWTDPQGRQALLELRRYIWTALVPPGRAPTPVPTLQSAHYF